jgi:hypothetical protein
VRAIDTVSMSGDGVIRAVQTQIACPASTPARSQLAPGAPASTPARPERAPWAPDELR